MGALISMRPEKSTFESFPAPCHSPLDTYNKVNRAWLFALELVGAEHNSVDETTENYKNQHKWKEFLLVLL